MKNAGNFWFFHWFGFLPLWDGFLFSMSKFHAPCFTVLGSPPFCKYLDDFYNSITHNKIEGVLQESNKLYEPKTYSILAKHSQFCCGLDCYRNHSKFWQFEKENFDSFGRKNLTVWKGKFWQFGKGKFWQFGKGKFWQFEKGNFDSLKRKIFDSLKKKILTVWKGKVPTKLIKIDDQPTISKQPRETIAQHQAIKVPTINQNRTVFYDLLSKWKWKKLSRFWDFREDDTTD